MCIRDRYQRRVRGVRYDSMALTSKLSALTSQLANVQAENDTIRARYLELEEAWQGMIDENKSVHDKNVELQQLLQESRAQNAQIETDKSGLQSEIAGLEGQVSNLTEELKRNTETLRDEELKLGSEKVVSDTLRREAMNFDNEGRKLRQDWEDKVNSLKKAQEDRDHFKAELHQLSEQYKGLVDDLSFCVLDYQVKTSSTQVLTKSGKYELLSTYLNRIYDQQEATNEKYKKLGEVNRSRSPYIETTVPECLVPSLLSPNANTQPVDDKPTDQNAMSWADAHRSAPTACPLSPNGRLLPVTPPNKKPGWNKY
eukprot:TRINITY_DN10977_c0_g1_i13.p1 TRINITY_DN10977_c0_g1~~TRINITY_DN10977_c0_g1_i13.p1  ORF type:complete len:313 (-),score=94.44 TRINITY_DN10977_c0_g1_i13:460-1398(-)